MSELPGLMIVPTRAGPGVVCLRHGRTPTGGERVGIAFTTEARLVSAMGPDQPWIRLNGHAIKAMLGPLGVTRVLVDPGLVAANVPTPVQA